MEGKGAIEPIKLDQEGVSCPRGSAHGLTASRHCNSARLPFAPRPSPESYAAAERRPRAVTAIAATAAAYRYPPQVSWGRRGSAEGRRDSPAGRQTHREPFFTFTQPVISCVASSSLVKLAPGAPSAGPELSWRGRGGRSAPPGRLRRGSARPFGHCPAGSGPADSLFGTRAPGGDDRPSRRSLKGWVIECAACLLLCFFSTRESLFACCGVMQSQEVRDLLEEGRGALTSSWRDGKGPWSCAEGGHPRDAPCAPPPPLLFLWFLVNLDYFNCVALL